MGVGGFLVMRRGGVEVGGIIESKSRAFFTLFNQPEGRGEKNKQWRAIKGENVPAKAESERLEVCILTCGGGSGTHAAATATCSATVGFSVQNYKQGNAK